MSILFKRIAVLVIAAFCGTSYLFSSDGGPIILPIKTEPDESGTTGRPQAPSRIRISAYYDGSAVVLTSTVATMAEVVISDTESGAYCFNGLAALAPDFRYPIAPTPGSSLMITVSIGSTVYEGILIL